MIYAFVVLVSALGAASSDGVRRIVGISGDVNVGLLVENCRNASDVVPYRVQTLISSAVWVTERVNYLGSLSPLKLGLGVYETCAESDYYKTVFDLYQQEEEYLLGIVSDKILSGNVLKFCEVLGVPAQVTSRDRRHVLEASVQLLRALGWTENVTVLSPDENLAREFYRYSKKESICIRDCILYGSNCPMLINTSYPFVFFGCKRDIEEFVRNQNFSDNVSDEMNALFVPLDGSVPNERNFQESWQFNVHCAIRNYGVVALEFYQDNLNGESYLNIRRLHAVNQNSLPRSSHPQSIRRATPENVLLRRDILEGNPILTISLLLAVMLLFCSVLPFSLDYNNNTKHQLCLARSLAVTLGYAMVFSLLLSRCILLATASKEIGFMSHIAGPVQAFLCLFIFGVQAALNLQIVGRCLDIFQGYSFVYLMSYNVMLLLLLLCLCPLIYKCQRNYREGKYFTFAIILTIVVWSVWLPCYAIVGGDWKEPMLCLGLVSTAGIFLGTVFIPRTYLITIAAARDKITSALPSLATATSAMDIYRTSTQVKQANTDLEAETLVYFSEGFRCAEFESGRRIAP
ncbi:hypothetical protein NQ318_004804 [Aromia moschata]|uniref:G-protein coupled receptors family 3 profile domain-containing protein n=1 Tax=Aromia moschata TaxID=1265417 RepID=A0AAV8XNZ5_9CUCU|nr:hypothetical protein NQ318_004804 [Aromia moschata]